MRAVPRHELFLTAAFLCLPAVAVADVVTDWNQKADECVLEAKLLPFAGTRAMAIVHVAMFDAVNSIEGHYTAYKFAVPAPPGSSPEAAGAASAHAALLRLFPEQSAALDARYAASLAQIPDGRGKTAGIAVGEAAAAKVLAFRASDGADAPNTYRPLATPGAYVATALPVGTQWGSVLPWIMSSGSQFRPSPPQPLSSGAWAADYNEVKEIGGKNSAKRTSEQTETARFWTITGPQSFDPIVRQLANVPQRSLSQNARLFALVEMAVADSYVAIFDAKYTFNFWRPVTAIRNGDLDGNDATARDAAWQPLVDTPSHPEYPCAHCINAGAARAVLESEFGQGPHPLTMTSATAPGVVHTWANIQEYADEVSSSRIYGGIHWRTSTVVAKAMGRKLGELAVQNYLRPVR